MLYKHFKVVILVFSKFQLLYFIHNPQNPYPDAHISQFSHEHFHEYQVLLKQFIC